MNNEYSTQQEVHTSLLYISRVESHIMDSLQMTLLRRPHPETRVKLHPQVPEIAIVSGLVVTLDELVNSQDNNWPDEKDQPNAKGLVEDK